MYNVVKEPVGGAGKNEKCTIYGSAADKATATTELQNVMAGGSLFIETDGTHIIWIWDELTKTWGEF